MTAGFLDIMLRQSVAPLIAQPYLSVLSFAFLTLLHFAGYRYLWKTILHFYRFENPFALLRFGTLVVVIASIVYFAFLFQPENLFSNMVWFLFFAITDLFFYMTGRARINRY